MRAAVILTSLLAVAPLAACSSSGGGSCTTDSDCGKNVCARDGECLPASDIRMVKVTWTIRGMPASSTLCAASPSFYLQFDGPTYSDAFGFEPVPCMEGQFTIDKIPTRFQQVEIGLQDRTLGVSPIAADGTASFDLAP